MNKLSRSQSGKLGYLASQDKLKQIHLLRRSNYLSNPNLCQKCSIPLIFECRNQTFCSHKCGNLSKPRILKPIVCPSCKKEFQPRGNGSKYCNSECRKGKQLTDKQRKIQLWIAGELSGHTGKTLSVSKWLREYLIDEAQKACSKCGWNQIHPTTSKCPLEINHINGNPLNSCKENLEVLCPNCHSLTLNFRALNKNSPRNRKKLV